MKKLQLQFENQEGKVVTYTLDDPVEPIDHEAVNEAMDTIIEQNAFNSSGGDLVAKRSACIVEQITEDIEIY
ncbi:DUF2922 domain-containing protein [Oceanobacillus sp. MO10714A]|uniref:DUF2922 domain-containing protein n=1 Tax=Oceanobacillus sp. MO10714A TaxID=3098290 RepID=UPI00300DFFB0